MPDLNSEPTIKLIQGAKTYLDGIWSRSHTDWAKWDAFFNLTFNVWNLEIHRTQRGNMRPGTAKAIIDHASDTYIPVDPTFDREPINPDNDAHRAAANRLEVGMAAIFMDSALSHELDLTWKRIFGYGQLYGYMVREGPLWNEYDKPEPPEREDGETDAEFRIREDVHKAEMRHWNPIRFRAIHPRRILLDPEQRRPEYAVKLGRWTAQRIHNYTKFKAQKQSRATARIFDLTSREPTEKLDVFDFYSAKWHGFAVGHKEGMDLYVTEMNRGGFVPFGHAYTGYGLDPTDLQDADPANLAVSLLKPVADDIVMDAQRINGQHELLMRRAYANLGTRGDPAEMMAQLAEQGIVQGDREDYFVLPTPEADQKMFQHGADLAADIEAATFSRQLAGQRQQGVNTVGATAIYQQNANRKFASSVKQIEFLASTGASDVLRLIDMYGMAIGARGKELRPADIYHWYQMDVRFEARDPVFELENRQQGMAEYNAGLIDFDTYHRDYRHTQDIGKVRKGLLADIVRQHPAIAAKMAAQTDVAQDAGLTEEDLLGEEAEGSGSPANADTAASALAGALGPNVDQAAVNGLNQGLTNDTFQPNRQPEP